jgi:hypothetical protein
VPEVTLKNQKTVRTGGGEYLSYGDLLSYNGVLTLERGRYPMMNRCSEPTALSVRSAAVVSARARGLPVPVGVIGPGAAGWAAR